MYRSTREIAEKKMLMLYILDRIGMKLTGHQFTKIITDNNFIDYFLLQQYLDEMIRDGFILTETIDNKRRYEVSPKGRQVLEYFQTMISPDILEVADREIRNLRGKFRQEATVQADYLPNGSNEYTVMLSIREDDLELINLTLAVMNRNDARLICENWKRKAHSYYLEIMGKLTENVEIANKESADAFQNKSDTTQNKNETGK